MKKTRLFFLLLTLAVAGSCKKESGYPPTSSPRDLSGYFESKRRAATQTFTIHTSTATTINGSQGTRIYIEPNAFTYGGAPVSGPVNIELIEVPDYHAMLRLNATTAGVDSMGAKTPLVSGGQVRLTASQFGSVLDPLPGKIKIEMFAGPIPDPDMMVFIAEVDAAGNLIWYPRPSDPLAIVTDSVNGYYQFPVSRFGWLNTDHFYEVPGAKTVVGVTLADGYSTANSACWLVLPNLNSVVPFGPTLTSTFQVGNIPVGTNAIVVVLHQQGSVYHCSFQPITVNNGHIEHIHLTPTTLADFEAAIDNL